MGYGLAGLPDITRVTRIQKWYNAKIRQKKRQSKFSALFYAISCPSGKLYSFGNVENYLPKVAESGIVIGRIHHVINS